MKLISILVVIFAVAIAFVQGHEIGHGGACDESDPDSHDHSLFCNPSLNVECVDNFCKCKDGFPVVDGNKCTAGASSASGVKIAFAPLILLGIVVFKSMS